LTLAGSEARLRLDRVRPRLAASLDRALIKGVARFEKASAKLDALSPYSVLERGYSLTTAEDGTVVKDASRLSPGARIRTRYRHGETVSTVELIEAKSEKEA
jgi:exodeoxyribonuclease VII large subunit